jgi:hypothetical protein
MTVEACVNLCNGQNKVYAGVENGDECCECTSRRDASCGFVTSLFFISRFGCQIVEMS